MVRDREHRWRLETLADGIALVPVEGAQEGAIRIRERLRPLRSAAHLFGEALARTQITQLDKGRIERVVTSEGEFAAFQTIRGVIAGDSVLRCFGAVFGDDHYTFIDAGTAVPHRFEELERNARVHTSFVALGLGHRRVRRFDYRPPHAWHPFERGLDVCWRSSVHVTSAITVYAARPATTSRVDVVRDILADQRLRGVDVGEPGESSAVFVESGLAGTRWSFGATAHAAIFEDERFVYPVFAIGSEALAPFDELLSTVQPIPLPTPRANQDSALHWAT